jgi:hypothetical protein
LGAPHRGIDIGGKYRAPIAFWYLLQRAANLPPHTACRSDKPVNMAMLGDCLRAQGMGAGLMPQIARVQGNAGQAGQMVHPYGVNVQGRHAGPRIN